MQRQYKELLITDEMDIARRAKAEGQYVVLSYPVQGMTKEDHLADYPYAVETTEQEPEEDIGVHIDDHLEGYIEDRKVLEFNCK